MVTPAAIRSQFFVALADAAHLRQLDAAVDALNLVWIVERDRLDTEARAAVDRDEIGQVVLPLGVLRCDGPDGVEQPVERERVDS